MKKSIVFLIHASFWAGYGLLLLIILAAAFQGSQNGPSIGYVLKLITGFALIPSIISFYSFYHFVFSRYVKTKKIFPAIGTVLILSSASAAIGSLVLSAIFSLKFMFADGFTSFITEFITITFIAAAIGLMGLVLKGFEAWYEEINLKQELSAKNHEMEMALVKAQLDPHFLFNTLNNIDVLILKNPEEASNYINKLSEIMRFMLFETKTDKIALEKEIDYIKKYVELQKIRSSNPDFVKLTIEGNTTGRVIAPMIFIPFIENAFKHVGDKQKKHAIEIDLLITQNEVKFECKNIVKPGSVKPENNGLGNELIQKRLGLLYPQSYQLNIENKPDFYRLTLSIQNES